MDWLTQGGDTFLLRYEAAKCHRPGEFRIGGFTHHTGSDGTPETVAPDHDIWGVGRAITEGDGDAVRPWLRDRDTLLIEVRDLGRNEVDKCV